MANGTPTVTQLPLGLGVIDWSDWFRGMIAAFISGGANAITTGGVLVVVDPEHFNLQHATALLTTAGLLFVVNGVLSLAAFLRTKSVPDIKVVKASVETTQFTPAVPGTRGAPGAPATLVVERKEETHTEPVTPPPSTGKGP